VRGEFAYASDLWHENMLWGATLRSPHPYARIVRLETAPALAMPGVYAVLTHEDVPSENVYGLKHQDTPVLAEDVVRYQGEPVALVAADHPEIARRALRAIDVEYEVLEPITDPERAAHDSSLPLLHPGGNVVRHQRIVKGDPSVSAEVVVSGVYEIGMQDQAFLGPEAGGPLPRHAVVARRPEADGTRTRPAPRPGAADAVRCRRGVRRPGGPEHAGALVHAGVAHRPSGEDGVPP
jgi:CO/xanthine dehydrogenase Mo-binding subunit